MVCKLLINKGYIFGLFCVGLETFLSFGGLAFIIGFFFGRSQEKQQDRKTRFGVYMGAFFAIVMELVSKLLKNSTGRANMIVKVSLNRKVVVGTLSCALMLFLSACEQNQQESRDRRTNSATNPIKSTPAKPVLQVKDWAYIVPLRDISKIDIWAQPGAKTASDNQIIHSIAESTKVGILDRKNLAQGSVYFHVELGDGSRGYVGRPYVTKDSNGYAFYEKNSSTGERLRDGKDYSFSSGNNCILHLAALMGGDLRKGEFETSAEFEARKAKAASNIPWFKDNITYTYVYSISGDYDADKQTFDYDSYKVPREDEYTERSQDYNSRKAIPYLEFDDDCTSEFGYHTVRWEEDYKTKRGRAETFLRLMGARLPDKFVDPENLPYIRTFGLTKRIDRSKAPEFKEALLMFGINPTNIEGVEEGDNIGAAYREPNDHWTKLGGDVSYMFLITRDGKNTIESYVSNGYQKTWKKDLQSQLTIAGYDVGVIDGVPGGATKRALESAVSDGILPNAEASMRSTMFLINHNRRK